MFRTVLIDPRKFRSFDELCQIAGVTPIDNLRLRLCDVPLVAVLVGPDDLPLWEPTMYLAHTALRSNSVTGDTIRSYAEALVRWLNWLAERRVQLNDVTEEDLGVYRMRLTQQVVDRGNGYSSATINHRVTVAAAFHSWGQQTNVLCSPLGALGEVKTFRDSFVSLRRRSALRRLHRIPTCLSLEQLKALHQSAPMPFRLMFRWCLATGLRRFEVCSLQVKNLPSPEQISQATDGILSLTLLRKGSRDVSVYVPAALLEETHWYMICERKNPAPTYEKYVFINSKGRCVSRQLLSRQFSRSAESCGVNATLHHLRHTFAVHVLGILDARLAAGDQINPIKTLQILMGHARSETTDIYLKSKQLSSAAVVEALGYLYGSSI